MNDGRRKRIGYTSSRSHPQFAGEKKEMGCNSGHSNRNGVIASVNVDISKKS